MKPKWFTRGLWELLLWAPFYAILPGHSHPLFSTPQPGLEPCPCEQCHELPGSQTRLQNVLLPSCASLHRHLDHQAQAQKQDLKATTTSRPPREQTGTFNMLVGEHCLKGELADNMQKSDITSPKHFLQQAGGSSVGRSTCHESLST